MFCKVVFDIPLDRDFDYLVPNSLEDKIQPGLRVTAPFGKMLTVGLVTQVTQISGAPEGITLKEIKHIIDEKPLYGSDLFPLAQFIKNYWGGPIGQILFSLVPPQPYFKPEASYQPISIDIKDPPYHLTSSQQNALNSLVSFPSFQFNACLLSGPSYTGKTETILRFAGRILRGYGQILITVPDIAAARQFIQEAQQRFGNNNVFAWHSRMLLSQKKKFFSAISNGVPCVVIGTRSAALLPFKNLRFISMLDEGDDNYKQEENKPYFHAREILLYRARQHGALFTAVTATPSVELLYAVEHQSITPLTFTDFVPGHHFTPQVKITEKKGEKSKFLSDFLLTQLAENIHQKQCSLLILNRQGYANAYVCHNCGTYAKCKKCGGILAREKHADLKDELICKKCGAHEPLVQECPKCHNVIFKSRGGGTQKIESDLTKLFPGAKILRLESNTLKTKSGQGFEALNALKTGQADIIIGTRVAAGALRGAKITLAAVLDAELELAGTDFRSGEKFARLLFDLRGHLSGIKNGRLVIQTNDPEGYDYTPVLSGDYSLSADTEMLLRESFGYPPYVYLFKLTLKSKDTALLEQENLRIKQRAKPFATEILGPVWCTKKTDTLKKQYLLFKTDETRRPDLLALLDMWTPVKKVTLHLAADPYDFY